MVRPKYSTRLPRNDTTYQAQPHTVTLMQNTGYEYSGGLACAHLIWAALWENDVHVTMVQRSSTHIVKSDTLMDIGLGGLYSEKAVRSGMTTNKADLKFACLPYRILHEFQIPLYDHVPPTCFSKSGVAVSGGVR